MKVAVIFLVLLVSVGVLADEQSSEKKEEEKILTLPYYFYPPLSYAPYNYKHQYVLCSDPYLCLTYYKPHGSSYYTSSYTYHYPQIQKYPYYYPLVGAKDATKGHAQGKE